MRSLKCFGLLLLPLGAAWLPGQTNPVTFLEPQGFGTGEDVSVAVADFNRDGNLDVAGVGDSINVYLGNGQGSFAATPAIGFSGSAIVAADFNGDGAPDLAIAGTTDLIVLLGNGDGTFRPPLVFPGEFFVLTVGDFNGDGRLDIAAGTDASQVQIFFGTSSGSFRSGGVTGVPTGNPLSIVSADFNGDGKADLAVSGISASARGITVLLGNGNGTFAAPRLYSTPNAQRLTGLVAVDANADGAVDLAYAMSNGISSAVELLLNQGHGTFTQVPGTPVEAYVTALTTGDLNGDGIPDLIAGGSSLAAVLFGEGSGKFQKPDYYVLGPVNALAVADFNNDGALDVAASSLYVMLGAGEGTFHSSQAFDLSPRPTGLATADLNRDGNLDLIVANDREISPTITVFHGNGKGEFGSPDNYPANDPSSIAIADMNGDGTRDIAFIGHNSVAVLPGNGDGTFSYAVYSPCGGCEGPLLAGDFNRDGIPDLLTWQDVDDILHVVILLGRGDGTLGPPVQLTIVNNGTSEDSPTGTSIADLRNNGILDIVVSTEVDAVYVLLGNGDGTFGAPMLLDSAASLGVLGDFNGDGNVDIAVTGTTIYLGRGDGTFTPAYVVSGAGGTPTIAGDFNGDGIPDLINVGNSSGIDSGFAFVLLGKGNGDFVLQEQPELASTVAIAGDFNKDGKLDLATYGLATYGFQSPIWILLNTTANEAAPASSSSAKPFTQ